MMSTTDGHLTDAEVLGVADAQLGVSLRARADAHLAGCDDCADRLQRLRLRQHRLSALLRETDFDVPAAAPPVPGVADIGSARERRTAHAMPRAFPTWLRIAAAIVLLLTATLAIPPVQAAVVGWLRAQWSRITGETAVQAPAPPTPARRGDMHIAFEHGGDEFRLELAVAQPGGTIAIRRGEGTDVVADADRPDIEPVLLPGGLRLLNAAAADASYELTVPPTVTTVTVVVAGETVARLMTQQLVDGVRLPVR
jgi:hypothetical protein